MLYQLITQNTYNMSDKDFKQILYGICDIEKAINFPSNKNYALLQTFFNETNIFIIVDIKKSHQKFQGEIEYLKIYPHHDKKNIDIFKNQLIQLCEQYKIKYQFTYEKSAWYSQNIFVRYWINDIEITKLVSFSKQIKFYD